MKMPCNLHMWLNNPYWEADLSYIANWRNHFWRNSRAHEWANAACTWRCLLLTDKVANLILTDWAQARQYYGNGTV